MAACLRFGWAATFMQLGCHALMERPPGGPVPTGGNRRTLSGILPGRVSLRGPRFGHLEVRPEFGEFWRVHVILIWGRILASRQNLLTNGNTHFCGHLSMLFI